MNYCSHCGATVTHKVPVGDNLPRHVCDECERIHYHNPKIVAGCIPEWEGQIRTVFAKQWVDLRSRIVTAETPAGGHWSDRLLARAKGLVRIEPIGAQTGESAAAVYSRVEAALERGDLGAALRESDSLPEPARAAAADWRAGVAQRVKAESAARGVVSESIGALARPKS